MSENTYNMHFKHLEEIASVSADQTENSVAGFPISL